MVDSTILFHNENNYILIITNNPVFVNKKLYSIRITQKKELYNSLPEIKKDLIIAETYVIIAEVINCYAGMVELADTPDLGSGGQPCRFKSCYPHQR